jgi:hypothetical protein
MACHGDRKGGGWQMNNTNRDDEGRSAVIGCIVAVVILFFSVLGTGWVIVEIVKVLLK